jgi:hypothetical protein
VWCWPTGSDPATADLATASRALAATFGPLGVVRLAAPRGGRPALALPPASSAEGWAVAAWLVTHAATYRLHEVRYLGFQWQAASGGSGWTRYKATGPRGQVLTS